MELEWFEDFLSVARTGNFSRSAEERSMTQSAFSRRIRALELWLGVTLIDRSTYPTRLTSAGQVFRDTAADTLRRLYAVRDELRDASSAPRDFISFSAMHSISVSFFPSWLLRLEHSLGPLDCRVTSDNMHNCVQQLIEGSCDFLLCYAHPAMPIHLEADRYPYRVLGQDRLIPVAAGSGGEAALFRLPGRKDTAIPYLGYAPGSFLCRAVEYILDRNDIRPVLRLCYENALAELLEVDGCSQARPRLVAGRLDRGRFVPETPAACRRARVGPTPGNQALQSRARNAAQGYPALVIPLTGPAHPPAIKGNHRANYATFA